MHAEALSDTVRTRLKAIDEADAKQPKDQVTGLPARRYWLWTEYSKPSDVVELPDVLLPAVNSRNVDAASNPVVSKMPTVDVGLLAATLKITTTAAFHIDELRIENVRASTSIACQWMLWERSNAKWRSPAPTVAFVSRSITMNPPMSRLAV